MSSVGVGDLVDGKYRVLRLIGEGGWGIVFEAENVRTLRRVALKILRNQANVTADIRARFEREAQAAGRIGSDHIVEVFDLGSVEDGSLYMTMELLNGEDLGTRLQGQKIDQIVAAKIVVQLLDGLSAAHNAGVYHRDLKPENLFLVPTKSGEEFVKILDFGISKFNVGQAPTSNTMTGAVLGSPCYMAPEQARGLKQIDARTDLYAVGTVLFECVTGRVPFQGDNFNDLMFRIVLAPRPDPREIEPSIDPALAQLILKAISVEPNDRFSTAQEFRDALVAWLEAHGVESVRAPEVRRTARTPMRTPPDARDTARPATRKERPHWSDATIPVDSGAPGSVEGTPIASTRTLKAPNRSKRRAVIGIAAAVIALLLLGGLALRRGHAGDATNAAGEPTAVAPPPAPPSVPVPVPTATATAATADTAPDTTAATTTPPGTTPTTMELPATPSSTTSAGSSHHHGGRTPVATKDAGPSAAEAPKPPPTAAPPAASTGPAKPIDKVEGREIRTNL